MVVERSNRGLNYFAPLNLLGYGLVGINLLHELCQNGVNPYLHPIGPVSFAPNEASIVEGCYKNAEFYDQEAPCLKIFHPNQLKEMIGRGEKIGFPIFELDRFTEVEKHQLSCLDKIFVTSQWGKDIIESNGIKVPVSIVNLGVNRKIFHEDIRPDNDIARDSATKFLITGKWEIRKGHDVVIDAFCKAFVPQDNVKLLVNCFNPFIGVNGNAEWEKMYLLSPMKTKIHIFNQRLPTQEGLAQLMASADCGIFMSRAEGWNLPLMEMMSCGKEVITTNATAHTEYVNTGNAMLVDVGEPEDAYDGVFFKGQGQWPSLSEISVEQLVDHMKQVHEEKQSGAIISNLDGVLTAQHFSWDKAAKQVIKGAWQ